MRLEIQKHWSKLRKVSKLSNDELEEARYRLFSKISFVNEDLIPPKIWLRSEQLVADIDIDDIDFVALTAYLKGSLWTGDKPLYNGLKAKNFKRVYNTNDLYKIVFDQ
jgi:predicted nucleic acid-binding protein